MSYPIGFGSPARGLGAAVDDFQSAIASALNVIALKGPTQEFINAIKTAMSLLPSVKDLLSDGYPTVAADMNYLLSNMFQPFGAFSTTNNIQQRLYEIQAIVGSHAPASVPQPNPGIKTTSEAALYARLYGGGGLAPQPVAVPPLTSFVTQVLPPAQDNVGGSFQAPQPVVTSSGLTTTEKVGIGVGIAAVVGLVAYLLKRKR